MYFTARLGAKAPSHQILLDTFLTTEFHVLANGLQRRGAAVGQRQHCARQPSLVPFSDPSVPLGGEKCVTFPGLSVRAGVGWVDGKGRGNRMREDGRVLSREDS